MIGRLNKKQLHFFLIDLMSRPDLLNTIRYLLFKIFTDHPFDFILKREDDKGKNYKRKCNHCGQKNGSVIAFVI